MLHALLRRTAMHARLPRAAPAAPAPALARRLRRAAAPPPTPPGARALAARAEPWVASYEREDPPFLDEGYSPEANAAYWATRPVAVAARSAAVAARLGGWAARGRLPGAGGPEARAAELLAILTRLGPAFVKIGQAVSARPDVLPPAYLVELEKLQDRLPPFPTPAAMAVLEAELGAPPSALFSSISAEPVAAASLGQVYRATLRAGGAEVAVKVQRPGVAGAIALDVFVLRGLARGLRAARRLNSDLPALLDEWAASLFRELDYRREAANGARFGELYGAMAGVLVPRMHGELTTRRVLVMEWVRGERLRSARNAAVDLSSAFAGAGGGAQHYAPADAARDLALVEVGVRCSLEQMLEAGFYHADPHPGNLLRAADGRLAYLDFGMVGEVGPPVRRALLRATLHLVNREYAALAEDFVALGMLPPEADRGEVVPALAGVFAKALAGGVDSLAFGALLGDLGQAMYRFQFRVPPYFTLLVRSLSVLEGIALAADPRYKVLGAAYPWVARRLLTDRSPELRATLLSLLYRTPGKLDFGRLESLLTQATRRGGGTAASRAREGAAAAAVGGSAAGDALALLLSPDGEFVRGVLVEELAKGADAATRLFLDSAVGEARAALAAAELGPPAGGTVLLRSLHDALAAVPPLADAADAEQVAGLRRLAAALQAATAEARAQAAAAPSGSARGAAAAAGAAAGAPPDAQRALEELAALAEWAAREAAALAPAERAEALRLPLEVAQAVASRAAARAIRFATSGSPTAPPPPGRAAPFSAGDAAADDDDAVLRGSRCAAGPPSPA